MFLTLLAEIFVILTWHGMWSLEDIWSDSHGFSNESTAWMSLVLGKDKKHWTSRI
jgi:hypothetical protein